MRNSISAWSPPIRCSFVDSKKYSDRLAALQEATHLRDAIISAAGNLNGRRVHICAMELKFVGGSMGTVVGEVITRAIERSLEHKVPLIIVSASGGARMQEGAVSLMQMAKISAALMRLDEARVPYISVLTDPTTGGVTASFAMLGDLNIAEPGALIGFAGPRVIEQTIRQKLPAGFQTSEFLLQHGFLDAVVKRGGLEGLYRAKLWISLLAPWSVSGRTTTRLLGLLEEIVERGASVVGSSRRLLRSGSRVVVRRGGIARHRDARLEQLALVGLILDRDSHRDRLQALEARGRLEMRALLAAMQRRAALGTLALPIHIRGTARWNS